PTLPIKILSQNPKMFLIGATKCSYNMAEKNPVSRFDVTRTIINFDTRINPSMSAEDFKSDMLDQPAEGSSSRECSILATFIELDRDKGLRMAVAKAREFTSANKGGRWGLATVGSCSEDLFWRVAVGKHGEVRFEIQVRESRLG
ncbi:MAG: hypothetical protein Q9218_006980, partial [Villophora microphyllina]